MGLRDKKYKNYKLSRGKGETMKKIFILLVLLVSVLALGFIIDTADATADTSGNMNDEVHQLFTKYYNNGSYEKKTTIFVDDTKEELLSEVEYLFHGKRLPLLKRTTHYSEGRLWMEEPNSGYKTNGSNMDHFRVVDGIDNVDYTVEGKTLDQYYISLTDFVNDSAEAKEFSEPVSLLSSWDKEGNVYYTEDSNVLEAYRLFTAPLWLSKDSSNSNYITYDLASLQVVNNELVMSLLTSTEEGKLKDAPIIEINGITYYTFSHAIIPNVQDELLVVEYDFDDYKGITQAHSGLSFDPVSGWGGFSCVTTDQQLVINGPASYRISIPAHSAWKQGAYIPLPNSSEMYTVAFKYKMITGDGAVKLGGASYQESTNFGLGFNANGDANHNIATNDCRITPMGNDVWSLIMVVTAGATDKYIYFSSLNNGGEYVIDDLTIYKGNKINEVEFTSNLYSNPAATNPIHTVDFENGNLTFEQKSQSVSTSIVDNGISGKSIQIDFTGVVSDSEKLISKQLVLEANTYYTITFKLRYLPTWDRWFHVNISNQNLQLLDYYMNLFTAQRSGYGYDNCSVIWNDIDVSQHFTVGFYTDEQTVYDLSFSCGTPWGFDSNSLSTDMYILIDDVKVFKGSAN